jgi:uncharacterized DUF497 family protein
MDFSGFDWDDGNTEKCKKHGLSQEDVESVFQRTPSVFPDLEHSTPKERRFLVIGPTLDQRMAFVAFTVRKKEGNHYIRPISARYMHDKEIQKFLGCH